MKKLYTILASLKLTIILMAFAMVLVFLGTILPYFDKDISLWMVVHQYFRSIIAWIDLSAFFPKVSFKVPFPGGFLIGGLLIINLLIRYGATIRVQATGKRRLVGYLILILGILATAITVIGGWGGETVAPDQNAAFWRVFFRLGRGSLAALILYIGCHLLFKKRAGLILLHAGILLLLTGEFVTAIHASEASMTLKEGETGNFLDVARSLELAITDTTGTETVIPKSRLKTGDTIQTPALPFTLKIHALWKNTAIPKTIQHAPPNYPHYTGPAATIYLTPKPFSAGSRRQNAPTIDVELFNKQTHQSIGRYLISLWFYPNFTNRSADIPTKITLNKKTYTLYLRPKREYLRTPSGHPFSIKLLDFAHETYEGSSIPKDFSSHILLLNPTENVHRELRIWMNNPLRYARYTFYQSGYLPDNSGTILQVVRNDTWMIPYLACMIVFFGMTAQFIQTLRRNQ
jgi:hypothetical protein